MRLKEFKELKSFEKIFEESKKEMDSFRKEYDSYKLFTDSPITFSEFYEIKLKKKWGVEWNR